MRRGKTNRVLSNWLLACSVAFVLGGCEKKQPAQLGVEPKRSAALVLAQAQFIEKEVSAGKKRFVPGPAKLAFVYPHGTGWTLEVLDDADSNVFHKAMAFDMPGERPGILTIAGNAAPQPALLEVWRRGPNGWTDTILW